MKTTVTLTQNEIKNKISELEDRKAALELLLEELFGEPNKPGEAKKLTDFGTNTSPQQLEMDISPNTEEISSYDSSRPAKALIVDILKKEGRPMTWGEIYDIFRHIRPDLKKSTVRISLAQMKARKDFPIGFKTATGKYFYREVVPKYQEE